MVDRYCRLRHWHRCYWLVADPTLGRLRSWGELLLAAVPAAGGTISASRQVLYNNLFTSLRSAGLLAKLDRLGIFAAENTCGSTTVGE